MSRYLIQFETRPLEGQVEEYNNWYNSVHVPDMLTIPGFKTCERYRVVGIEGAHNYIAAYVVDCDDPQQLIANLALFTSSMTISPAIDLTFYRVHILEPV
jgi:hypothetical protein